MWHFLELFFVLEFVKEANKQTNKQKTTFLSLSSGSYEYDDSFLLLLSETLTTLVAFFPTKGELMQLWKSLEKVSAITLQGPST